VFNVYHYERWTRFLACCWRFVFRGSAEARAVRAIRKGKLASLQAEVRAGELDVCRPLTPAPSDYSSRLRRCENKETLLHKAAAAGDLATVIWLVDQGAEVECFTDWGRSPIMAAAAAGHAHVVAWLASRGADPHRPLPSTSTFVEEFTGPSSIRLLSYHDIDYTGHEHLAYLEAQLDERLPAAAAVTSKPRF